MSFLTQPQRGFSPGIKPTTFCLLGVHVYQEMYGCEWDTETNNVTGYDQLSYNGEDFLAFDLKTETWIAPKQQAVIAKQKCDSDRALSARQKNYFTHICPEWLKKYLNYSGSSLRRTVLPSVSLLQKSSSSPITCHATGFYPHKAKLLWRKDGKELHEGVNRGEILPNNDGTLQTSADLDLSSVKPEDWRSYDCVFQLCGVNKDIITRLGRAVIRTNEGNSLFMIIPMILALGVLAVITVIGFIIYKKKTDKRPPSPVENCEVQEKMIPCEA
ncbi:major histocompatibility complex class I-related gene protein isoform X1 [Oreochromis niloticus]|uniref:major histocompatibility complex class I-related gene protein isoform X1 n=1 Tax=Oreochromis niloticus TaxID=8128 RepID=UPI000DF31005|nr:major histocompatibility complex class I-related gene protein-like isoform X1 [Oreochromis niloticus]